MSVGGPNGNVWITLKHLGLEFDFESKEIAGRIGKVIDEDNDNKLLDNPRFLVRLDVDSPRTATIILEAGKGQNSEILVEYEDLEV